MRSMQSGIALVVVLVWLMVAMLLAISATQIFLQDHKALINLRDREIAFQAAEAGLRDAESEIAGSVAAQGAVPEVRNSFSHSRVAIFPRPDEPLCHSGSGNAMQGLCRSVVGAETPAWLAVDLASADADVPVPYGRFTGRTMPTGAGPLPARAPRYLIERIHSEQIPTVVPATATASSPGSLNATEVWYRITAIGFGARAVNQVVLQSYFRVAPPVSDALGKAGDRPSPAGPLTAMRVGWREILNWQELHQQLHIDPESS